MGRLLDVLNTFNVRLKSKGFPKITDKKIHPNFRNGYMEVLSKNCVLEKLIKFGKKYL